MNKGYNPYRDPSNGRFTTGPSTVNKETRKDGNIKYDEDEASKLNKREQLYKKHKEAVKELANIEKYDDGTYDLDTLTTVEFSNGYQVTFWQVGDDYSEAEYTSKVRIMTKLSSDGRAYAGAFTDNGRRDPEVSWHFNSKEDAIRIAKENNQVSIWDYENQLPISTGGTGIKKKK